MIADQALDPGGIDVDGGSDTSQFKATLELFVGKGATEEIPQ
jgi:hypothetical protein